MNLFVLDTNPLRAARMQCDTHVVKMTLEAAQLLSTCHRLLGSDADGWAYQITHEHHPCRKWVSECTANYRWAYQYFKGCAREYTYRYGKVHRSWRILADPLSKPPTGLPRRAERTPFALAMPDKYKQPDAVAAYRAYYLGDKADLLLYTRRQRPEWMEVNHE